MCIGGRLGCHIDLDAVAAFGQMSAFELLYSESASRHIVTIRPDLSTLLDTLGMWQLCRRIGEVSDDGQMIVRTGDSLLVQADVEELAQAFKKNFF